MALGGYAACQSSGTACSDAAGPGTAAKSARLLGCLPQCGHARARQPAGVSVQGDEQKVPVQACLCTLGCACSRSRAYITLLLCRCLPGSDSSLCARYKDLRVYDVVTSAALSLVKVVWTSPADPPPPALTGGVSVANLGFSLQSTQQVSQPRHFVACIMLEHCYYWRH